VERKVIKQASNRKSPKTMLLGKIQKKIKKKHRGVMANYYVGKKNQETKNEYKTIVDW
jgi:hypothetical protein